jgi:hypothetical protein
MSLFNVLSQGGLCVMGVAGQSISTKKHQKKQVVPSLKECLEFDLRYRYPMVKAREKAEALGFDSIHQAIADMAANGRTMKQIAAALGMHEPTVYDSVKRMGLDFKRGRVSPFSVGHVKRACSCCGMPVPPQNRMLCLACMRKPDHYLDDGHRVMVG